MRRQSSQGSRQSSSSKKRLRLGDTPTDSAFQSRRSSQNDPLPKSPRSDFGEEIEDQYYKRSVPTSGGLLLSPKRQQQAAQEAPNQAQLPPIELGNFQNVVEFNPDEVIDLDEAQFAHLSEASDLVGNAIDDGVVDEAGFDAVANFELDNDDDGDLDQFSEGDFQRFQAEMQRNFNGQQVTDGQVIELNPGYGGGANEADLEEVDMKNYLDQEQHLEDFDAFPDDVDDYGMKVSSPQVRQKSIVASKSVSPSKETDELEGLEEQEEEPLISSKNAPFPERDPSQVQLMRDEQAEQSRAHALEMNETNQTMEKNGSAKLLPLSLEKPLSLSQAITQQMVSPHGSRRNTDGTTKHTLFQPPIQIKSFVRLEGMLPSSLCKTTQGDLHEASEEDAKSGPSSTELQGMTDHEGGDNTSLLQQTPFDDKSKPALAEDINDEGVHQVDDLGFNEQQVVKVSQFTDQSKSESSYKESAHQEPCIDALQLQEELSEPKQIERDSTPIADFSKTGQPNEGALAMTRSDFARTKGAELVLKDLLLSSSPVQSSQHVESSKHQSDLGKSILKQSSVTNSSRVPPITHQLAAQHSQPQITGRVGDTQQSSQHLRLSGVAAMSEGAGLNLDERLKISVSTKKDCGPDGHDTPESMNHYSDEEGKEDDGDLSGLKLDQKLPSTFSKTLKSARSSLKPDAVSPLKLQKEASRAFLEDKPLEGVEDHEPFNTDTEFKMNIDFDFKNRFASGLDEDSEGEDVYNNEESQGSEGQEGATSENGDLDDTQRIHTTQHVRVTSDAHKYEPVALESEVGNPVSKTAMGFNSSQRAQTKRASQKSPIAPGPRIRAETSYQAPNRNSRVDQKRQIDSKLSIVRRNAEKLKQSRKETSYMQSAAATRTKSTNNSILGTSNCTSSKASRPRASNMTRLQSSQKVLPKELDKAPLPLASTKNKTQKQLPKKLPIGSKRSSVSKLSQPDQVLGQTKKTYLVAKSRIPKQALANAQKSIQSQSSKKSTLPSNLQRLLMKPNLKSGISSTNLDPNPPSTQLAEARSHKSINQKPQKLNLQAKQHLAYSAKPKNTVTRDLQQKSFDARGTDSSRQYPPVGRVQLNFEMNQSSSQASLAQNTNDQSLKRLQEKYRRGSPRVYNEKSSSSQKRTSILNAFDRKPPRVAAKMTAAEVREQSKLEKQEQVLKVQLSKIESKLDQKRREVSQGSRKAYQTPSVGETRQSSLAGNSKPSQGVVNQNASFTSQRQEVSVISESSRRQNTHSVCESISKYKQQRNSIANPEARPAPVLIEDHEPGESAEEVQAPYEPYRQASQTDLSNKKEQTQQLLSASNPSTKPGFESPRATTINLQANSSDSYGVAGTGQNLNRRQNQKNLIQPSAAVDLNMIEESKSQHSVTLSQQAEMGTENGADQISLRAAGDQESLARRDFGRSACKETAEQIQGDKSSPKKVQSYPRRNHADQKDYKNIAKYDSATAQAQQSSYRAVRSKNSTILLNQNDSTVKERDTKNYREYVEPSDKGSPGFTRVVTQNMEGSSSDLMTLKRASAGSIKMTSGSRIEERDLNQESSSKLNEHKDQKTCEKPREMSPSLKARSPKVMSAKKQHVEQSTPRVSLTPVLKDSSQAQKLRKESFPKMSRQQSKVNQTNNRSYMSQANKSKDSDKDKTNSPSMFKGARSSDLAPTEEASQFFQSNLYKRLRNNSSRDKYVVQPTDVSDIPSRYSKKDESSAFLAYVKPSSNAGGQAPSEPTFDVSANLSQAVSHPQKNFPRLKNTASRHCNTMTSLSSAVASKPPKTVRKIEKLFAVNAQANRFAQRQASQPSNMTAIDYIEEAKDYERVIHGLQNLLENPRQHQPLNASSTSNISYHTGRVKKGPSRPRPLPDPSPPQGKRSPTDTSPPTRVSPRMMRKIKGQLLISEKRGFDSHAAVISLGPKRRHNQTVDHDQTQVKMFKQVLSPQRVTLNTSAAQAHQQLQQLQQLQDGQRKVVEPKKHQSHASISAHSGVSRPTSQAAIGARPTSIMVQRPPPGRIHSQRGAGNASQRTMNSNGSRVSSLSKAELRRKEQFDRSLQREVHAIEKIISHKQDQPRVSKPLTTPAMINEYVDSLKVRPPKIACGLVKNTMTANQSTPALPSGDLTPQEVDLESNRLMTTIAASNSYKTASNAYQSHLTSASYARSNEAPHTVPASDNDQKAKLLMEQIRQLQPMVADAADQNAKAESQLSELVGLHDEINRLQDSSQGVVRPRQQYNSLKQLLEANNVEIDSKNV